MANQSHRFPQAGTLGLHEFSARLTQLSVQGPLFLGAEEDHGNGWAPPSPFLKQLSIVTHRPSTQREVLCAARPGVNTQPRTPQKLSLLQPAHRPLPLLFGQEDFVLRAR